jgi:hypothetical protein
MKSVALKVFLVAAAATALIGCTIHPIYNVKGAPIEDLGATPYTMDDIEKAIRRAGALLGWRMQAVRPGLIVATIQWGRGHIAVVDVTYDTKTYDITYKDSTNLDYNGTEIHRNYNYRVQELDKGIRAQLLGV